MTYSRFLALLIAAGSIACWRVGPARAAQPQPVPVSVVSRPDAEAGPTEVSVRMWMANIDNIDSAAQSFGANFLVQLRWRDPRLAPGESAGDARFKLDEIWHPRILLLNPIGAVRRALPETVDVEPDGTVTYRQRFVVKVSQRLDLSDFPFDTQDFSVHVISVAGGPDDIQFVPDALWTAPGLKQAAGIAEEISLPDWEITGWEAGAAPYVLVPGTTAAGYAMKIEAKRAPAHYVRKVILPLILIVMMSWAVFWIDPTNAGSQISVAVTSMLTLIAYRFAVGGHVPRVPYTTRMDTFILAATVLVFLSLTEVILTAGLVRREREGLARKIDRVSRVLFPITFTVVAVLALVA